MRRSRKREGEGRFTDTPGRRGFTLAELMVVVVIMGILAGLGTFAFRKQLAQSKNTEALAVARSIAAAQEKYRAETLTYLDVSNSLLSYYPTTTPGPEKMTFWGHAAGPEYQNWQRLGPKVPNLVRYGYAVVAGLPREGAPTGIATTTYTWPAVNTITEPWYVLQAIGDVDGDGVQNTIILTSFGDSIYQENIGE